MSGYDIRQVGPDTYEVVGDIQAFARDQEVWRASVDKIYDESRAAIDRIYNEIFGSGSAEA